MQNCYLFCLWLSFRLKVTKRYLFWKKSQVFSAFEWLIFWISEWFRQFYFFTKRSTLLVKTSRKTKFLQSLSVEQNTKLLPFLSGIFSFRVNDILTSILSALHPFLTLPNDVLKRKRGTFFSVSSDLMKGTKRYLFCSWKRCSQKREKGTFLAVGSDVLKSAKKVPLIVFSSHGKPFRILLIDRCQLFGVIFMNFLSEFTNPLVKR